MQDIVQELRSIQTLLDLLMQKRLQLPSGRRAQLERTCDQFQQVMGSLAQVIGLPQALLTQVALFLTAPLVLRSIQ